MTPDLARRRSLLTAVLGLALDTRGEPVPPELQTVPKWLDNWTGVGHIMIGMQRQNYDLELARHDGRGWSATLRDRHDALADERHGHGLGGADTLACGSGGRVECAREGTRGGGEPTPAEDVILP
jgi:hypothetical protein